jgi:hypothetical protein
MAKKKTILVETHKAGRSWSIKVSASGDDIFQLFASMVRGFAADEQLDMLNNSDPFPPVRKRKKVGEET